MSSNVKPFTVILPVETHEKLAQLAREEAAREQTRVGASDLVRRAIEEVLKIDASVDPPGQPKTRRRAK